MKFKLNLELNKYIIHLDTDNPKVIKKFTRKLRWALFWHKYVIVPEGTVRVEKIK